MNIYVSAAVSYTFAQCSYKKSVYYKRNDNEFFSPWSKGVGYVGPLDDAIPFVNARDDLMIFYFSKI